MSDSAKPTETKEVIPKQQSKKKQVQKDPEVLKLLEEEQDDFQQFEEDAYDDQNVPAKIDPKQWRQDWDDQDINDEFTMQLKKQLKA